MKKVLFAVLVVLGLALTPGTSHAILGVEIDDITTDFTNGSWNLGWRFQVNNDITVTDLGLYDDGKNGFSADGISHIAALWTDDGTLLSSVEVTGSSELDNWFRFESIDPVLLSSGSIYRIAAITGSQNYTWNPNIVNYHPDITFLEDRWTLGTTLLFPESTQFIGDGFFGGNFRAGQGDGGNDNVVPEPASMMLLGSGLLGMIGIRNRKAKV